MYAAGAQVWGGGSAAVMLVHMCVVDGVGEAAAEMMGGWMAEAGAGQTLATV